MISNRRRIVNEYKVKIHRLVTIQGDLVIHPNRNSNEFHELNNLFQNLVEDSDRFFQTYTNQIIDSGILPHAWSNILITTEMQIRVEGIREEMEERKVKQRLYRIRQQRRKNT